MKYILLIIAVFQTQIAGADYLNVRPKTNPIFADKARGGKCEQLDGCLPSYAAIGSKKERVHLTWLTCMGVRPASSASLQAFVSVSTYRPQSPQDIGSVSSSSLTFILDGVQNQGESDERRVSAKGSVFRAGLGLDVKTEDSDYFYYFADTFEGRAFVKISKAVGTDTSEVHLQEKTKVNGKDEWRDFEVASMTCNYVLERVQY